MSGFIANGSSCLNAIRYGMLSRSHSVGSALTVHRARVGKLFKNELCLDDDNLAHFPCDSMPCGTCSRRGLDKICLTLCQHAVFQLPGMQTHMPTEPCIVCALVKSSMSVAFLMHDSDGYTSSPGRVHACAKSLSQARINGLVARKQPPNLSTCTLQTGTYTINASEPTACPPQPLQFIHRFPIFPTASSLFSLITSLTVSAMLNVIISDTASRKPIQHSTL
jgi:hypothetical protein